MIEAQADIRLGEGIRPSGEAHRHFYRGGPGILIVSAVIFALFITAGGLGASALYPAIGRWADIVSILLVVVGAIVAMAVYSRFHMRGILGALRRIGSPAVCRVRYQFDDHGISTFSERVSHSAPWESVLFMLRSSQHWLAQIDTTTIVIPFRAFGTAAEEQAFVALAKSRLSEDASSRSVFESQ